MSPVLLTLLLALGWAAATGNFSLLNLLFGGAVGGLCLYLIRGQMGAAGFAARLGRVAALAGLFAVELVASALRVARLVLRPDLAAHLKPAIVAFPLSVRSDAEITLLANLITLTPGTLSVDVSEDRRLLYIHVIELGDREAFVRDIAAGFEARVREACR